MLIDRTAPGEYPGDMRTQHQVVTVCSQCGERLFRFSFERAAAPRITGYRVRYPEGSEYTWGYKCPAGPERKHQPTYERREIDVREPQEKPFVPHGYFTDDGRVIRLDGSISKLPNTGHRIAGGWARYDPSYDEAVDVVPDDYESST